VWGDDIFMSNWFFVSLVYLVPMALMVGIYVFLRQRRNRTSTRSLAESMEAGLTDPVSLHPIVDPKLCIGCGSCVSACPEKGVLGLIHSKAELINPTACVGHGACKTSCPEGAITLVFGTRRRGVDIPEVSPDFESTVPGIFVAGELGGMGLIRNATEQGKQAVDAIAAKLAGSSGADSGEALDCLVVGAGPAGLSATLRAMEMGLKSVTIDQDAVGGTVAHFPRGKLVMTSPAVLPIVGKMPFTETSREAGNFDVKTSGGRYRARAVLLAIGRRGTPRKLGVPGEDDPKVTYRLADPQQYRDHNVLVVGGGDSALEAACSIAEAGAKDVRLSYRGEVFQRAKVKNRERLEALSTADRLEVLMGSNVINIGKDYVVVRQSDREFSLPNSAIIVCVGGVLPAPLLQKIGMRVTTKYGTP
jgi:thioredoxin reductase/NAD-dependent dihydropyrimidine dehydrogenase PreA subunit